MPINLSDNIYVGVNRPLESKYLYGTMSYSSTASACVYLTQSVRYQGLTVLIGTQSNPQEYWWQNGTSDSQLVLKQSGGTGNITGSASSGYVTLWTGTTSVGYTSSLYWDNPTNGLLVGSNLAYGTHSLQVTGGVHFRNSGTNSIGIDIYNGSTSNSQVAIYSSTYKSAFSFLNLTGQSLLKGSITNSGPVLLIEDTSVIYSTLNNLTLKSNPATGSGGTGSFNFLTFASYPDYGTLQLGSSLDQQYYYRDITQLNLGNTVSAYRPLGLYGVIYESGTFSFENSSFRWRTMVGGSLSETMKLLGTNLLIGYTQSQGTYSLQVNGNTLINGNTKINGYIQIPSNSTPITSTSSLQLYASLSSAGTYDTLTYVGRDGKLFNIGNSVFITVKNSGTYSLDPNKIISINNIGQIVYASPDTYQNQLLGITVDSISVNGYGRYVSMGVFRNINLWNYVLGTKLYVDYGGGLTSSSPVGYPAQCIGIVGDRGTATSSNDGSILINPNGAYTPNWSNSGTDILNNNTGNVLIGYSQSQGAAKLQVSGSAYFSVNISASGSITAQTGGFDSDARLKSNIVYNPVIEGIDSIKSASYIIGGNNHIGYIAQDVENIVPSSIIKKDDGYLALNYNEVLVAKVAFLENKVKELSDIIERNGLK